MAKKNHAELTELQSHDEVKEIGSDRSFGIVFTVVFAIVGCLPLLKSGEPRYWALGVSGAFLVVALVIPKILHPLNVVWMKLAMVMNMIVSPIVLGLLFFVTITPLAVLMRLLGKDLLRLKFDKNATSYWIARDPPGPPPESMKHQF